MKQTIRKASTVPILGVGAAWLFYGLFLPLYRPWHLLFPILLSALVYAALKKLFPGKLVTIDVRPQTGDEALDAWLEGGEQAIEQLQAFRETIPDEAMSGPLRELEQLCSQIFQTVRQAPEKLPQLRRFTNYYLPTTLKLVQRYSQLQQQAQNSENVRAARKKIEDMMGQVIQAFRKQLDALYQKDVMDITADVQVLEQMMKAEGILADDAFNRKEPEEIINMGGNDNG